MQMYFWTIAAIWLIPLVPKLATCYIKNGDLCATESNLELSYPLKSNLGMHHSSWQHNRLLSSWEVSSEMGRIEHTCNFFVWSLGRGHQHAQLFSGDKQTQQNTEVAEGHFRNTGGNSFLMTAEKPMLEDNCPHLRAVVGGHMKGSHCRSLVTREEGRRTILFMFLKREKKNPEGSHPVFGKLMYI